MPTTLRALLADRPLGLRVLAGSERLDDALTWVHVSELDDPTPFLAGGELLLTTGLGLPDRAGFGPFVDRLRGSGVAGLGFGTGLSHDEVPAGLRRAAEAAGLPLLEVPRRTPFIAISKAVSGALAAEDYAEVTRTDAAQHALTRAALGGRGEAGVVRRLAKALDAWVLLLDGGGSLGRAAPAASGRRLAAIGGEIDRLRARGGPASTVFTVGADTVSAQALGGRGFLVVGSTRAPGRADQQITASAAGLLTLLLARTSAMEDAERQLRSGLMRLLLDGGRDVVAGPATRLGEPLPSEPVRIHAVRGPVTAALPLLAAESRQGKESAFHGEDDGELLVVTAHYTRTLAVTTRLPGLRVGRSEPVRYAELADGRRQAVRAAESADRTGRPLVDFAELADPGLLGLLPDSDARAYAESLLAPLRAHDARGRGDLVASLTEWLRGHGQWDPAAARLGVHRHTLRNRMARVAELLDRDLDSPRVRAELWLAIDLLER